MRRSAIVALALSAACGGDDVETQLLTCELLIAGDTCWDETLAALAACADPVAPGQFNAAGDRCEYSDGTAIDFAAPLETDVFFDFTLPVDPVFDSVLRDAAGGECARVAVDGDSQQVTVDGQVTRFEVRSLSGVLTCPDGTAYEGGSELFACAGEVPGFSFGNSRVAIQYSLVGGGNSTVFDCIP